MYVFMILELILRVYGQIKKFYFFIKCSPFLFLVDFFRGFLQVAWGNLQPREFRFLLKTQCLKIGLVRFENIYF